MKDIIPRNLIDASPKPTDWQAGGETGIKYVDRGINWAEYLPTPENQYKPKTKDSLLSIYDSLSCVSFSYCNSIETQVNATFLTLSETNQRWLVTNGYWVDGQCNLSDRFLAKMSKTTKERGNSLPNVADTACHVGLIPDSDWPFEGDTWDEYMAEIPEALKKKALEFLEHFELPYEWVWTGGSDADRKEVFAYHLKQAPLFIGSYICPMWNRYKLAIKDEVIQACPYNATGHATIIYDVDDVYHDFDHYPPYQKRLALDYPIKYAMKVLIQEKIYKETPTPKHNFTVNLKKGDKNSEVKILQQFLISAHCLKDGLDTGYYGSITAEAVLAFQKLQKVTTLWENLYYKGEYCGPKTRAAINLITNHV